VWLRLWTAASHHARPRRPHPLYFRRRRVFFAGISTKLSVPSQRLAVLGLGYLPFVGTAIWMATFPVTISV
jgi:hypothetical protein